MALVVDTSQLDVAHRAEALRTMLISASGPHELTFLGPAEQVHARLEHWQFGASVGVLQQESSGIAHSRDERYAKSACPDRVVFVLHDGGPGSYVHDGHRRDLERGSLYVTRLDSEYSYSRPGNGVARIVVVERAVLGLTAEAIQTAARRLVSSPLYGLLRSHIGGLCRDADQISASSEAAAVGEATARLTAGLLRTTIEPSDPAGRGALLEYLRDRVRLFIQHNHTDADLNADQIACAHHVSTRYLFKIWATQSRSLEETIMTARLETACRLLRADPNLTIAAAAHRSGFSNASHFSRRFRLEYGLTPSQWRRES